MRNDPLNHLGAITSPDHRYLTQGQLGRSEVSITWRIDHGISIKAAFDRRKDKKPSK